MIFKSETERFEVDSNDILGGGYAASVIRDIETGVHYIVAITANGVSITPLLNADGTIYTKLKKENSDVR